MDNSTGYFVDLKSAAELIGGTNFSKLYVLEKLMENLPGLAQKLGIMSVKDVS